MDKIFDPSGVCYRRAPLYTKFNGYGLPLQGRHYPSPQYMYYYYGRLTIRVRPLRLT